MTAKYLPLKTGVPFFVDSQMKSPGITTSIDGKNRTLYMQTVKSIEEKTRGNLKKTLKGLYSFLGARPAVL